MTVKEHQTTMDALRKVKNQRFADSFEVVQEPFGYRVQHKVTGQSPQAYAMSCGPQREL